VKRKALKLLSVALSLNIFFAGSVSADEISVSEASNWFADGSFLGNGSSSSQTYILSSGLNYTVYVTDFQWKGDLFSVLLNGAPIGDTSVVTPDANYQQYDPQLAWEDANFSKGTFVVTSGGILSIVATSSPFGGGAVAVKFAAVSQKLIQPLRAVSSNEIQMSESIVSCKPGAYTVGQSEVKVDSYIYRLYVNGSLKSTVAYDAGSNIPAAMVKGETNNLPAALTTNSATWDLSSLKDYSVRCEITAVGYNSSVSTTSATYFDSAYQARVSAAAQAWEDQRSTATAANFTKDMREMRKRLAARQP
jgi:hypothetical protein